MKYNTSGALNILEELIYYIGNTCLEQNQTKNNYKTAKKDFF